MLSLSIRTLGILHTILPFTEPHLTEEHNLIHDRRSFLGMTAASIPTLSTSSTFSFGAVHSSLDQRFIPFDDYRKRVGCRQADQDLSNGLYPVTTDRAFVISDANRHHAIASRLSASYNIPERSWIWARLLEKRASAFFQCSFLVVGKPVASTHDWWLFISPVNTPQPKLTVVYMTSDDSLSNLGMVPWLMARIAFRLHRIREQLSNSLSIGESIIGPVNRQIIRATRRMPI